MTSTPDPSRFTPPDWPTLIPRIVAHDAKGLVNFIKHVFAAIGTYKEGAPGELRIGDSMIMISGAGEREPATAFLYVYVEDTDAAFQRALESGATSIEAPLETPYGDRRAMITDPWGNTWQIATHGAALQS